MENGWKSPLKVATEWDFKLQVQRLCWKASQLKVLIIHHSFQKLDVQSVVVDFMKHNFIQAAGPQETCFKDYIRSFL